MIAPVASANRMDEVEARPLPSARPHDPHRDEDMTPPIWIGLQTVAGDEEAAERLREAERFRERSGRPAPAAP